MQPKFVGHCLKFYFETRPQKICRCEEIDSEVFRHKCGLIFGFCNPPLPSAQSSVCYNVPVFKPNCGPRAHVLLDRPPLSCLFGLVVVRARARVVSIAVRVARISLFHQVFFTLLCHWLIMTNYLSGNSESVW
jgi:hypothetical protein